MGKTREIAEYFLELCREVEEPRLRSMFGGHGLYTGDAMFGLEAYGELYLKTDEETRAEFEAIEARPFVYEGKDGKKTVMSYYTPPSEYLEDSELLTPLVRLAVDAALRAKKKSRKKTAPTKKSPSPRKTKTGNGSTPERTHTKKKGAKKKPGKPG